MFANVTAPIMVFVILFFIVWFGIAIINLINPRWIWRITASWKARRDPPPAYFLMRRVWAAVMLAIGIGFIIWPNLR